MESYFFAIATACWLGILTSLSPCPMATNIAAITYIGKLVGQPSRVLLSGLLYTLGRTISYVALGVLVVARVLSIPDLAFFLQNSMNKFLGPILILVGLFLLGLFRFRLPGIGISDRLQRRIDQYGMWGAGLLGLLFALSFCPVSAALFFGSLIPIAIEHKSSVLIPTTYAIGTAVPVVAFSVLIAIGTRFVGAAFNKLTIIEKWARRATGIIFIIVGIYYSIIYLGGVDI